MAKQSIIDNSELTNLLGSGAILQVGLDQFKLIWGPFRPVAVNLSASVDEKTVIYKPDFWDFTLTNLNPNSAFSGMKERVVSRAQLLELLNQQNQVEFVAEWQPVDESVFVEQFNWSQKQFAEGMLKKTVPIIAQQGRIDFRNAHLIKTLISILSEKHYGTTYGFWDNGEGYLGHTPELILDWSKSDQILRTMALAGTKDARKESTGEILHDSKILDEHQIVVDDLKSVLAKVDPAKKIEIDPIKVLELKYLCHLQTEIRIPNLTADKVLNYIHAIHPTAALGLYPRISEGYTVFKNFPLQNARRNFAAPFAFIHKDHIKAVAAIRLFYFNSSEVKIISGCGVTAGSVLVDELHELENKRNSVKRMMGMNV